MSSGKIIRCKAAIAWGPGEPLIIEEIQVDPPKANEIRIKITHTSLCHSDITYWQDKEMKDLFPRIFGHEAAGIVESVGEHVEEIVEGDHVVPIFQGECSHCKYCKSGKTNLCGELRADPGNDGIYGDVGGKRFVSNKNGTRVAVSHFLGTSTFSEYTVVNKNCVAKVSKDAPLDKICLLSCGITTGLGAAWNTARIEPGSTVAIFGLGTVGLAIAHAAKLAGAVQIIGVDIHPGKHLLGNKFGITDFINPKDQDKPTHEVIHEISKGGVDYAFECIGNTGLIQTALQSTHDGWGVAIIAGVPTSLTLVNNPFDFLFGRTLKGTIFGGYKRSEIPSLVEKYMKNEIEVDMFITHTLPFERINEAFELLIKGESLRCVLNME